MESFFQEAAKLHDFTPLIAEPGYLCFPEKRCQKLGAAVPQAWWV
jgi:hypothetical protein